MSRKASKRARRRQLQGYVPDGRRGWLTHMELKGRVQTTPAELRRQAVQEPFYLHELGLTRDCSVERVPGPGEPVPVIRRARS